MREDSLSTSRLLSFVGLKTAPPNRRKQATFFPAANSVAQRSGLVYPAITNL